MSAAVLIAAVMSRTIFTLIAISGLAEAYNDRGILKLDNTCARPLTLSNFGVSQPIIIHSEYTILRILFAQDL